MLPPNPLTADRREAIEARKALRARFGDSPQVHDAQAASLRAAGATWQKIAEEMGYANGAIARRAAMRHAARQAKP